MSASFVLLEQNAANDTRTAKSWKPEIVKSESGKNERPVKKSTASPKPLKIACMVLGAEIDLWESILAIFPPAGIFFAPAINMARQNIDWLGRED